MSEYEGVEPVAEPEAPAEEPAAEETPAVDAPADDGDEAAADE